MSSQEGLFGMNYALDGGHFQVLRGRSTWKEAAPVEDGGLKEAELVRL